MNNKINFSSEYFRGIISLFKGTFWAQLLGFLGTLLVAKLYGSNDFGVFSKFISLTTILSVFYTLRLESTLVLYNDKEKIRSLFSTAINIVFFIFFITLLFTFFIPESVFKRFNFLKIVVIISIVGALIKAIENLYINYLIKEKKFKTIANVKVLFTVTKYTLQICFFYIDITFGLIIGFLLATFTALLFLINKTKYNYKSPSLKRIKKHIIENKNLVSFGLLSDNLNIINITIIPILAGVFFEDSYIGWYYLSITILSISLSFISSSFSKIFFLKVSNIYNTNKENIFAFIKKSTLYISLILIIPLIIFTFWGDYFTFLFFDKNWGETGIYIKYLAFLFFLRSVYNPLSYLEEVYRKNHIGFLFNVYLLIVNIIVIYIGFLNNNFLMLVKYSSFLSSLGYLFMILYFLILSKKISEEKI